MPEAKPLGRFVWFDLMTTDPAAATAFYSRVTGWGTDQFRADTGTRCGRATACRSAA